jgi:hypothetical protein
MQMIPVCQAGLSIQVSLSLCCSGSFLLNTEGYFSPSDASHYEFYAYKWGREGESGRVGCECITLPGYWDMSISLVIREPKHTAVSTVPECIASFLVFP